MTVGDLGNYGRRILTVLRDPMPDTDLDVPVDASAATDRDSWLALIDRNGEEEGYLHPLGPRHWAMFVDDGPTLMVSFETIAPARARRARCRWPITSRRPRAGRICA